MLVPAMKRQAVRMDPNDIGFGLIKGVNYVGSNPFRFFCHT